MTTRTSSHCGEASFSLGGGLLAGDWAEPLWAAIVAQVPDLAAAPGAGLHPLRGSRTEHGLVLSRRTRLQVRVPLAAAESLTALCGQTLAVGGGELHLGEVTVKAVTSFATLGARCVVLPEAVPGETGFAVALQQRLLDAVGDVAVICGRPSIVSWRGQRLTGYSVVAHDLTPGQSLALQEAGLGEGRGIGCGLFIHHKIIAGLDDDLDAPD